mgnify:CR=1 FL=1
MQLEHVRGAVGLRRCELGLGLAHQLVLLELVLEVLVALVNQLRVERQQRQRLEPHER